VEDLYDQIKRAAGDEGLYAIDSHGWLNEHEADPEFLGHAMWQTDQPTLGESGESLTAGDVELLTAGEDFYGLMEAARIAAGLAVLRLAQISEQPFHEDQLFWSQTLQAVVALGTATDRLQAFARVGFQMTSGKPARWEAPFETATTLVNAAPPPARVKLLVASVTQQSAECLLGSQPL